MRDREGELAQKRGGIKKNKTGASFMKICYRLVYKVRTVLVLLLDWSDTS